MEQFIEEVQKREFLWYKKDPKYKNKVYVNAGWEEIGKICNVSKERAKKKWRNLRDTFLREYKKIPANKAGGPADEAAYQGKWMYFENLTFLRVYANPSSTEANPTIREDSPPSATKPKTQKKILEQLLSIESEKLNLLQAEEDENLLFFKSLLPYMERFSPLQQLRVRNNISDCVMTEFEGICNSPSFQNSNISYSPLPTYDNCEQPAVSPTPSTNTETFIFSIIDETIDE